MFLLYENITAGKERKASREAKEGAYAAARSRFMNRDAMNTTPQGENPRKLFPIPHGSRQPIATVNAILHDEEQDSDWSYQTPREEAPEAEEEFSEEEALPGELAAINNAQETKKLTACFHNLLGTCNKGELCTHSHSKEDAMELLKVINANIAKKPWHKTASIAKLVKENTPGNDLVRSRWGIYRYLH